MHCPNRLLQGATKSVAAFVRVFLNILNAHLGSISEIFIYNVGVPGQQSQYGEEEVEGPPAVGRFVMEHLQNLDNLLTNVE
jgi:hypothetical protein